MRHLALAELEVALVLVPSRYRHAIRWAGECQELEGLARRLLEPGRLAGRPGHIITCLKGREVCAERECDTAPEDTEWRRLERLAVALMQVCVQLGGKNVGRTRDRVEARQLSHERSQALPGRRPLVGLDVVDGRERQGHEALVDAVAEEIERLRNAPVGRLPGRSSFETKSNDTDRGRPVSPRTARKYHRLNYALLVRTRLVNHPALTL